MFRESSKRAAQLPEPGLKRPPHVTPRLWERVSEIMSRASVSDDIELETGAVLPPADTESYPEQSAQSFEDYLSPNVIFSAIVEARRNGDPAGHMPTIY